MITARLHPMTNQSWGVTLWQRDFGFFKKIKINNRAKMFQSVNKHFFLNVLFFQVTWQNKLFTDNILLFPSVGVISPECINRFCLVQEICIFFSICIQKWWAHSFYKQQVWYNPLILPHHLQSLPRCSAICLQRLSFTRLMIHAIPLLQGSWTKETIFWRCFIIPPLSLRVVSWVWRKPLGWAAERLQRRRCSVQLARKVKTTLIKVWK